MSWPGPVRRCRVIRITSASRRSSGASLTGGPDRCSGLAICIGGGGKQILKIAAEFANVVDIAPRTAYPSGLTKIPWQMSREAVIGKVEYVKHCAGERFASLLLGCVIFKFHPAENREAGAHEVHAEMDAANRMYGHEDGFTLSIDQVLQSPYLLSAMRTTWSRTSSTFAKTWA